jgi:endonuclease-3
MSASLPPAAKRIGAILGALDRAYPAAACSLRYTTPLELLVATILSAQCTDVLVNQVTVALFKKYRTASDYARAGLAALERDISRVNFYRNKAKSIRSACQLIVDRFGGEVPGRMDELLELPGVARKTANVVLGNAFGIPAGVVVDTHVMRLSRRIGLSAAQDRDKIELDLMALVPKPRWIRFGHQLIIHGRLVCTARAPRCLRCPLGAALCPSYEQAATVVRRPALGRRRSH